MSYKYICYIPLQKEACPLSEIQATRQSITFFFIPRARNVDPRVSTDSEAFKLEGNWVKVGTTTQTVVGRKAPQLQNLLVQQEDVFLFSPKRPSAFLFLFLSSKKLKSFS